MLAATALIDGRADDVRVLVLQELQAELDPARLAELGSWLFNGQQWDWVQAFRVEDDKLVETASTNPPTVYGFGHEAYYRNVLSVLRGEARPDTDGREGRKSLELILGIYESAKTGREVPLPLRPRL